MEVLSENKSNTDVVFMKLNSHLRRCFIINTQEYEFTDVSYTGILENLRFTSNVLKHQGFVHPTVQ